MRGACSDKEPILYQEAVVNSAWKAAMIQEFEALHANNIWEPIPLPVGKQTLGCKWVHKVKHKVDGSIREVQD